MELQSSETTSFLGKMSNVVLVLLVLVALGLSYLLYQRVMMTDNSMPSTPKTATGESFNFPPLSAEEQKALATPLVPDGPVENLFDKTTRPAPGAPPAEVFMQSMTSFENIAVATDTLAMGAGCRVSPVVVKVAHGTELKVHNYDTTPHQLIFNASHAVSIPAGGVATLPINFGKVGKTYAFGCEGDVAAKGFVWIAE